MKRNIQELGRALPRITTRIRTRGPERLGRSIWEGPLDWPGLDSATIFEVTDWVLKAETMPD